MALTTTELGLLLLGVVVALRVFKSKKRPPLPPGPPGLPVLGNLFDIPTSFEWEVYGAWADTYGPLVSVSAVGTTIVIVNKYKTAMNLLADSNKGSIYSSRPYIPMAELMSWEHAMAFTPYGPRFRRYRQVFHEEIGNYKAMSAYFPQEVAHARRFLKNCLDSPDRLFDHAFQHAGAIILRIAYGYTATDENDEFVEAGNTAMESFNEGCSPGNFMVNQMPILKYVPEWIPGAGFQKKARLWRPLFRRMVDLPFDFVKKQLAEGTAENSFTARWLKKGLSQEDEDILRYASGSMFGGGGETTAISIQTFFLAMVLHPEIQLKAQEEMDSVTGGLRLPTFEDRNNLPYLDAIVMEILRYHPATPTALPHCTTEDDVHEGYFIPKGTIVIPNIWKMMRDPDFFAEPDKFNPKRFMGESGEMSPQHIVFGFGRRLCPGRHLADISLFITIATCIAALDISPAEENGKPVLPELKGQGGVVNRLEPFKCKIAPKVNVQSLMAMMGE